MIVTITHVAIKTKTNKIVSLPKPFRHHHLVHYLYGTPDETPDLKAQGFLDSDGNYLNRKQALVIAKAANQYQPTAGPLPELYSEDVWVGSADSGLIPSLINIKSIT